MTSKQSSMVCPTCGGTEFRDRDGGPDSYEDDIFYIDEVCTNCGTYLHGWTDKWMTEDDDPVASNQERSRAREQDSPPRTSYPTSR